MTYLDYLLTHTYIELPAQVRAEITAEEYAMRQAFVRELSPPPPVPPALLTAYREKVAERKSPWVSMRSLAAAGWLLAAVVFFLVLARRPHVEYQYVGVPAAPEVRVDTVSTVVHDTIDRVIYRTRLLRDTFFAPAPPPGMLVLRDTVFVEAPVTYPTGTATVDKASLSLLVGSRGE